MRDSYLDEFFALVFLASAALSLRALVRAAAPVLAAPELAGLEGSDFFAQAIIPDQSVFIESKNIFPAGFNPFRMNFLFV